MNEKQIRQRIKALEHKARDPIKGNERYKELSRIAGRADTLLRRHRARLEKKHEPIADDCWREIDKLRILLKANRDEHAVPVNDRIQEWLRNLGIGIEGSQRWRIQWVSADEKYAVLKMPGHVYWSGIGFRNYAQTQFELWPTNTTNRWSNRALWSHEGRWSKGLESTVAKQELTATQQQTQIAAQQATAARQ
jgi:hypothetical protein